MRTASYGLPRKCRENFPGRPSTQRRGSKRSKPLLDSSAVADLAADPITPEALGFLVRAASAAEGIEDDVPGLGRDLDRTGRDHGFQLVDARARLRITMAVWRGIVPEISEVQPFGVEVLSMPAIVFEVSSAMATARNWDANSVEDPRLALGKIEQRVMSWIELLSTRKSAFHRESDPVAEIQAFIQVGREVIGPAGQCIDKERPAGDQSSAAFVDPQ
jgi:hypothetical protein